MFSIFTFFYAYARPLIKWLLRRFTRLCELQRICYGEESGAKRKKAIEQSLAVSRAPYVQKMMKMLDEYVTGERVADIDERHDYLHETLVPTTVTMILKVKKIKPKVHPDFAPSLGVCIETIWSYRRLCFDIENLRKIPYDSGNFEHEDKLLRLWRLLMPDQSLEARITKQWQDIGFQGDDPMTDFRGMGLLGLENLLYFAEEYNAAARHVLSHSTHPIHGYTFAIVGINLTSMAYNLVQNGAAKTHLYNLKTQQLCVKHFHRFYCYLFFEFDKFWIQYKPTSLMEFSTVQSKFLDEIRAQLNDDRTVFNMNQVYNI